MKTTDITSADFVLAVADLKQSLAVRGGRMMAVAVTERYKGQSNIHLEGKVLWFWPGKFDQYVVHRVSWLYREDGVHLGHPHHVDLVQGHYFLFGSYADGEPAAYQAALADFDMR